jgi:hypothetical protein
MPRVGFKLTTPMFEGAKTVEAIVMAVVKETYSEFRGPHVESKIGCS